MNETPLPFEATGALKSFNNFFELKSEGQAKALELMSKAVELRKKWPGTTDVTQQAEHRLMWQDAKKALANEFATSIDSNFAPGMGGNDIRTMRQWNIFTDMLGNHSFEEIEEARDKLQEFVVGKE